MRKIKRAKSAKFDRSRFQITIPISLPLVSTKAIRKVLQDLVLSVIRSQIVDGRDGKDAGNLER